MAAKTKKRRFKRLDDTKVAIIADRLTAWGGAEYTVKVISEMYPDAVIYTSVYDKEFIEKHFPDRIIKSTFIQHLPFEKALRNEYSILYWLGFKLFNLRKYDVVVSVSSAYAKMVSVPGKTKHISICLTPPRFLWMNDSRAGAQNKRITYRFFYQTLFKRPLHWFLRKLDNRAVHKVDVLLAISGEVANRIRQFYNVDAQILYPPVDLSAYKLNKDSESRGKWMLYLGRVETYKGVEMAIRACVAQRVPLQIAGTGSDMERMQELVYELNAKGMVKFHGFVSDEQRKKLFYNCRALLYPVRDEDFGIVPIEANASGAPVIAYRGGGVVETLCEDNPRTVVFFDDYSVEGLTNAIAEFDKYTFNPDNCRKQATMFAQEIFEYKLEGIIKNVLSHS